MQASVAGAAPSLASTTGAVTSNVVGPNEAWPTAGVRLEIDSLRSGLPSQRNTCMRGGRPSDGVDMFALLREPPSALSWASPLIASCSTPPRP